MNKQLLIGFVAVLMLLALPYAFADDGHDGSSDSGSDTERKSNIDNLRDADKRVGELRTKSETKTKELIRDASGKVVGKRKTEIKSEVRIREARKRVDKVDKNSVIERKAFTKLKEEEKIKFKKLHGDKLGVVSSLETEQVSKLKDIRSDRLRILASKKSDDLKKLARLKKTDFEKVAKLDRHRIKEFTDLAPEEAEARLKKIRVVKANEDFKFRPLTLEKVKTVAKSHKRLKEVEVKLREKHTERIDKLKAVKERVKTCKENSNAENCEKVNEEALDRAKEAALNIIERLVNHIDKIKDKLEGSQDLTEADVAEKISRLDSLLGEVDEIKISIEAATTKRELNDAVKDLRAIVNKIKVKSKAYSQGIIRAHTIGIIHRSEIAEKKLDCSLSALEDEGLDIDDVDAQVDEFSELIHSARDNIKEAKNVFDKESDEAVEESKLLISSARDSVKEAQSKLVDIRKTIVDLGGTICTEAQDIVIEDDEEVEVEEEETEDVESENEVVAP
ncbi:hypothetical protein CMO88_00170 [Candidatus Woesearchaeota archaeon]|nr:hypothetical protein [Candidatus Woesearchaeota archaeon]|tara:strand:- start:23287 stop:24804 length:1518 start_codon:yes stop_codon:yes gene_type:complete